LESRRLLSTVLFSDSFTGPNSWDINQIASGRQSGQLAPLSFQEPAATAPGGALNYLTQVNNPAVTNTLLMGVQPAAHQTFTYVSPNQDFGDPRYGFDHVHVDVTPLGPASSYNPGIDHWAALVFGAPAGSFIIGPGTGVLIRAGGGWQLFDRGVALASGDAGIRSSYALDFDVTPGTGHFTLSIDGQPRYSGDHGGMYTQNRVTLEDATYTGDPGYQLDYFGNLQVTGAYIASPNTTYYVSPTGNDSNTGTSPFVAWRTITRVNLETFQPGDGILLQGGSSFSGSLGFSAVESGTTSAPLVIGSYGGGTATINAGNGDAITLLDTQHVTIANLRLVGSGYNVNQDSGLHVVSDAAGPLDGLSISSIDASGFGHAGIGMYGPLSDVSVTYSSLHDNGDGGLWIVCGAQFGERVYVGHVQASHNAGSSSLSSGFGIVVANVFYAVIERSVALNNGWLPGNRGEFGGIEALGDFYALVQYNEAGFNHHGTADGDGLILDTSFYSIVQFNYAHDNDGGGLFLGAEAHTTSSNDVIRFNISQNDARASTAYGGMFIWSNVNNSDIYNNTIYITPSPTAASAALRFFGFTGSNVRVFNNIFAAAGGSPVARYDGGGSGIVLQGNDYWSYGGAAFQINWAGASYATVAAFGTATGQELLNGMPVGRQLDPGWNNPGGGGTIGNADLLATLLTAYQLQTTSPIRNLGLDLSQFGIVRDPWSFATNSFLSAHFQARATDFYNRPLPPPGSRTFSIGANQAL
jgi:hypothetical protein